MYIHGGGCCLGGALQVYYYGRRSGRYLYCLCADHWLNRITNSGKHCRQTPLCFPSRRSRWAKYTGPWAELSGRLKILRLSYWCSSPGTKLTDASQQHSNCSAAHLKSKYLSKANSAKVWHVEKTGDKMTIILCLRLSRQKGAVLQSGLSSGGKCKLLRNRFALSDPPVLSK